MKSMQKKFTVLGTVLIVFVVLGLVVQYMYLNNITAKAKKESIISSRDHLADNISKKLEMYRQYVDITAEIIGSNRFSDDDITEYVTRLARSNDLIKSVYYGDLNNKLLDSDNWNPPEEYDVRTRPWYIEASQKDDLVISDVYTAAMDGSTVISISKPVYDEKGEYMGVVSSDIAVEEIIKMVESSRVQGAGYSILIDGSGNILAHPKYKYNIGSGLINIDSLGNGIFDEIQTMKMGQIKVKLDGIEGYLTYRPIKNTNWVIGNFISLKSFEGKGDDLWRIGFIALVIAIMIFSSFTSIQKKSFIIPVLKLDKDIRKINLEENIGYRIPIEKKDHFRGIKETLNMVLSKTQDLFEQVEQDKMDMSVKNAKLNHLSYNDQLTGLYNRRYFEEKLKTLDIQSNLPISLIMGDANGLKLINDSFGHQAGDNLLISIADVLKEGCRIDDIISRISGDEFVIVLPRTTQKDAALVIERIQAISLEKRVACKKFKDIEVSVSYGLGTKESMETDILSILSIAEENMYSKKLLEGPEMRRRTISTIMYELYKKDKNKKDHSRMVAKISREIGIELGIKGKGLEELENAGKLHDIGEISIRQEILNKTEKLTVEEVSEIRKHPEIGYRILSTLSEISEIAYYVLSHHERYDGSGYPKGLAGEQIPLESRIIAIADAYDAMRSDRPYRKALDAEEIMNEFKNNAGSQFDPDLTKIFLEKVIKKQQG